MASLTSSDGNTERPYSITVKLGDVSLHSAGAARWPSAGAAGCSAPGFWIRLPCGIAAPASEAQASAANTSATATMPVLHTGSGGRQRGMP